jgi:iron complex outermembrane receptor protein
VTTDGSYITQNAAKAHVDGLEVEFSATPVRSFNVYGNLALTDDGYNQLAAGTQAAAAGATQLPLLSHVQAQLGGSWRYQRGLFGLFPVIIASDWSHRSPYYSDPANSQVGLTTTSDRLNASVEIQSPDKHWSIVASGRNLNNEKYYTTGLVFSTGYMAAKMPAEEASGMLTVKYRY